MQNREASLVPLATRFLTRESSHFIVTARLISNVCSKLYFRYIARFVQCLSNDINDLFFSLLSFIWKEKEE